MSQIDVVNAAAVAIASCYLTTLAIGETKPRIDEDGEEVYTLAGWLLVMSADVIKYGIITVMNCFSSNEEELTVEDETFEDESSSMWSYQEVSKKAVLDEDELIV